jgi:hypothetical protein
MKRLVNAATLCILAVTTALSQTGSTAKPAEKSESKPVALGSKESAKWTKTTEEAATNEQQKAWLGKGKPGTITGELVDISCYMQLGKTGEKHIDCGSKCARNGQPVGVLTSEKELYVVMPEEHHPRRDGQVDIRDVMASNMGKQVVATGMVQETKQGKALFVSAMDLKK